MSAETSSGRRHSAKVASSLTALVDLGLRIERLTIDPDAIDAPMTRLVRPLMAALGFAPKVEVTCVRQLLKELKIAAASGKTPFALDLHKCLESAIRELEANVTSVERATIVGRRPLVAHAAWLRRIYEVVVRAERAVTQPSDGLALETASAVDEVRLLPPLAVRGLDAKEDAGPLRADAHAANLVAVELGAIDHLLAAANEEGELLGRRRRLLEAARQMLLETSAAVSLDASGMDARRRYLAKEIARVDRLEAAGLLPDVALTHQARQALSRGERQRLHAAVVAMQGPALARGDVLAARLARRAMSALWKDGDTRDHAARQASSRRSADEVFGAGFGKVVADAYARGRKRYEGRHGDQDAVEAAKTYLLASGELQTLSAAIAVGGCFETGGALTPARILDRQTHSRAVRFPTKDLVLLPATQPDEIADAVIEDPRRVVLDLAAGRLLARRFVQDEVTLRPRVVMQGEIRVYVLDGSGSMIGPRARVRDALLLAELATLRKRVQEHGKGSRVVLFYRYFDTVPQPITRVTTAAEVDRAMSDVLSTMRAGGTDIEAALLSSIQVIRAATEADPDLSHAHIVLVTDGESPVDGARVIAARDAALGRMPIGTSVIALGQQNPALAAIVAKQRAKGERAFYHYVPDDMLADIVGGELDDGPAIHLPGVGHDVVAPDQLDAILGSVVDEMAALARQREVEAMEALDNRSDAEAELGMERTSSMTEGEKARARALHRDRLSLVDQFDRWFPKPALSVTDGEESSDAEAVSVVLATVAEVLDTVGGSDLARRADAIDLLERLLPDSRLSPARWREVTTTQCTKRVAESLTAVRVAAKAN